MNESRQFAFASALVIALSGCAASRPPVDPVAFEGDWVISNFEENHTVTHKYEGRVMTIRREGNLFRTDSPEWAFDEAKFAFSGGRTLNGVTMQSYEDIKGSPGIPDTVLREAALSKTTVVHAKLEMLANGTIHASRDNFYILHTRDGRFDHTEYVNWIQFTLTRE